MGVNLNTNSFYSSFADSITQLPSTSSSCKREICPNVNFYGIPRPEEFPNHDPIYTPELIIYAIKRYLHGGVQDKLSPRYSIKLMLVVYSYVCDHSKETPVDWDWVRQTVNVPKWEKNSNYYQHMLSLVANKAPLLLAEYACIKRNIDKSYVDIRVELEQLKEGFIRDSSFTRNSIKNYIDQGYLSKPAKPREKRSTVPKKKTKSTIRVQTSRLSDGDSIHSGSSTSSGSSDESYTPSPPPRVIHGKNEYPPDLKEELSDREKEQFYYLPTYTQAFESNFHYLMNAFKYDRNLDKAIDGFLQLKESPDQLIEPLRNGLSSDPVSFQSDLSTSTAPSVISFPPFQRMNSNPLVYTKPEDRYDDTYLSSPSGSGSGVFRFSDSFRSRSLGRFPSSNPLMPSPSTFYPSPPSSQDTNLSMVSPSSLYCPRVLDYSGNPLPSGQNFTVTMINSQSSLSNQSKLEDYMPPPSSRSSDLMDERYMRSSRDLPMESPKDSSGNVYGCFPVSNMTTEEIEPVEDQEIHSPSSGRSSLNGSSEVVSSPKEAECTCGLYLTSQGGRHSQSHTLCCPLRTANTKTKNQ